MSTYTGTIVVGTCPTCSSDVYAQPGKGRPRRYCSVECKHRAKNKGPRPPVERFMMKIEISPQGCWLYGMDNPRNPYGTFWVGDSSYPAHRWSYEHHIGPIPTGMWIDHLCRTPRCVNPQHLEPVTPSENRRRAVYDKKRTPTCTCACTCGGDQ